MVTTHLGQRKTKTGTPFYLTEPVPGNPFIKLQIDPFTRMIVGIEDNNYELSKHSRHFLLRRKRPPLTLSKFKKLVKAAMKQLDVMLEGAQGKSFSKEGGEAK